MEITPAVRFDDTAIAFNYKSDKQLRKANFIFSVVSNPFFSGIATGAVKLGMSWGLPITGMVRATVFDHFCGGETIAETEKAIQHLGQFNVKTILDYSVEGEKNESGFDRTTDEIIETIEKAKGSKHIPFTVFKVTGMASTALLEKMQQKLELTPEEQGSFEKVRARVDRICSRAHKEKVPVLIDAEESWIQDPIDRLANEMMEKYNREGVIVLNTFQMYRSDMMKNLHGSFHHAAANNYHLGIKLVRGAYMEKERERATELNYPSPIHPTKEETDKAFNQALSVCMDQKQRMALVCGSHNEQSNQYLTGLMEKHGIRPADPRVWFAQLLGMSDNISFNLAKAGYNVAKYVPYGPVASVMPYLLRRAAENTSVAGQSSRELMLIRKELKRRKNRS